MIKTLYKRQKQAFTTLKSKPMTLMPSYLSSSVILHTQCSIGVRSLVEVEIRGAWMKL